VSDSRCYPDRPYLAVSAAIFRAGRVLLVRRGPGRGTTRWTLPGGVVELGETLEEALMREVAEETALRIEPLGLAGYRNVVIRDADGRVERHFVVLPFAARWLGGECRLNAELSEARWTEPGEVGRLATTDGLADVIAAAQRLWAGAGRG
jgi:ADP-ribose pyrophosphatase YjhB (NUDIX family)